MAGGKKHGGQKVSTKEGRKRERRPKVSEGPPQFEVTGTHVVVLVGALFALAWFAGLLPEQAESRETPKELARRRDARHGPRGLNSCRPERLLHRQSGLELLRERGHDPPRAGRGADELEPPSAGFSPARVV